jgi:hypothetical protein
MFKEKYPIGTKVIRKSDRMVGYVINKCYMVQPRLNKYGIRTEYRSKVVWETYEYELDQLWYVQGNPNRIWYELNG